MNTVQNTGRRTLKAYKAGDAIILSEEASVRLYNMIGEIVRLSIGRKINIYGIAKGVYLLKGKLSDGTGINEKMAYTLKGRILPYLIIIFSFIYL